MHALYILVGAVALLIILLFFSLIALLWGLRQLLIIRNQNDTMISLLQHIPVNIWNEAPIQGRLQEDNGEAAPTPERVLKLHRQIQGLTDLQKVER
jgi:hypothetical protein